MTSLYLIEVSRLLESVEAGDRRSRDSISSASSKRVSLTRRLSRIIAIEESQEDHDPESSNNQSTIISLDSIAESSFADPHLNMYRNR